MTCNLEAIQERYQAADQASSEIGISEELVARLTFDSFMDVPGLVMEVEALRAELKWVRSVVTLHQQNGCGVALAALGESRGGDRPPYDGKPS